MRKSKVPDWGQRPSVWSEGRIKQRFILGWPLRHEERMERIQREGDPSVYMATAWPTACYCAARRQLVTEHKMPWGALQQSAVDTLTTAAEWQLNHREGGEVGLGNAEAGVDANLMLGGQKAEWTHEDTRGSPQLEWKTQWGSHHPG